MYHFILKKSYQINMFLYAFSLEHEPHIMVVMWVKSLGATDIKIDFNCFGQSAPGNTPNAGRFTRALMRFH